FPVPHRGQVGNHCFLCVSLVTAANEAYQAASAVTMPTKPPIFVNAAGPGVVFCQAPMASSRNVSVSSANTASTAPLVRSAATVMYPLKMNQANRYRPTVLWASAPELQCTMPQ